MIFDKFLPQSKKKHYVYVIVILVSALLWSTCFACGVLVAACPKLKNAAKI